VALHLHGNDPGTAGRLSKGRNDERFPVRCKQKTKGLAACWQRPVCKSTEQWFLLFRAFYGSLGLPGKIFGKKIEKNWKSIQSIAIVQKTFMMYRTCQMKDTNVNAGKGFKSHLRMEKNHLMKVRATLDESNWYCSSY